MSKLKLKPKLSLPVHSVTDSTFSIPSVFLGDRELATVVQQIRREVSGLPPTNKITYSLAISPGTVFFNTEEVTKFNISVSASDNTGYGYKPISSQICKVEVEIESNTIAARELNRLCVQSLCVSIPASKINCEVIMFKDDIVFRKIQLSNAYIVAYISEIEFEGKVKQFLTIEPDHWVID